MKCIFLIFIDNDEHAFGDLGKENLSMKHLLLMNTKKIAYSRYISGIIT